MRGNFGIYLCLMMVFFTTSLHASLSDDPLLFSYAKGNAVSSELGSVEYSFKNPATGAFLTQKEFQLTTGDHFGGAFKTYYIGVALPQKKGVLTLHLPVRQIDGLNETVANGGVSQKVGKYSDTEAELSVGYSFKLNKEKSSLGLNVTYQNHTIANESATGVKVSLGGTHRYKNIQIGQVFQNVISSKKWTTGRTESDPFESNTGVSFQINDAIKISTELTYIEKKLKLALGGDIKLSDHLVLMLGDYDVTGQSRLTAGVSLRLKGMSISYVMGHHEKLDTTHKVGVSLVF